MGAPGWARELIDYPCRRRLALAECGIRLGEFNEYQEGDIIECYKLEKYAQTL